MEWNDRQRKQLFKYSKLRFRVSIKETISLDIKYAHKKSQIFIIIVLQYEVDWIRWQIFKFKNVHDNAHKKKYLLEKDPRFFNEYGVAVFRAPAMIDKIPAQNLVFR